MFRDKEFNLSILFSSIWHLFWICVIGIVITPSVQTSDVYQEVSFFGPILEKTAFDIMVDEVIPQAETLYARSAVFVDKIYLKPEGPERKTVKEFTLGAIRDKITFSLHGYVKDAKEIPVYFSEDIPMVYAGSGKTVNADSLQKVEGPAGEREVIFKPEAVTISRGLYRGADEYLIKLKFFVSGNGIVYDVNPVISSGYPEVDIQAIRFVKRWRFSPLSVFEEDESTWGIVTLKVDAR